MTKSFIDGKNFYLRLYENNDRTFLQDWLNDKDVTHFLEMGTRPIRQLDLDEFYNTANSDDTAIVFTIVEKKQKKPVGYCGLYLIDWIARRAQLNILIGEKKFWSRGIGSEACHLLVNYAFRKLNLNSVQLGVNTENSQARKAYEKVGFILEGNRREFLFCNGKYYDMACYSILKSDYDK